MKATCGQRGWNSVISWLKSWSEGWVLLLRGLTWASSSPSRVPRSLSWDAAPNITSWGVASTSSVE